jgi:hypothetical protein
VKQKHCWKTQGLLWPKAMPAEENGGDWKNNQMTWNQPNAASDQF